MIYHETYETSFIGLLATAMVAATATAANNLDSQLCISETAASATSSNKGADIFLS